MRIFRNILSVIVGWLGGSLVNGGLVMVGHTVFPIEGLDPNDMEALAAAMPTMGTEHFVFPFLAHALGTLAGAFIAALIAGSHKMTFAYVVGGVFFVGGIAVNYLLPGPMWFAVVDILIAYIPMAWIGGTLARKMPNSGPKPLDYEG